LPVKKSGEYMRFFILILIAFTFTAQSQTGQIFKFQFETRLPGAPELVFDQATGDISAWWDHTFSEKPVRLYIEPKPGGGFYEIFDSQGNGVLHATVTGADRGKMLRMDGPLGLAGRALHMVTTYTFETLGTDSTLMKVGVHAAGEFEEGLPAIVESVWKHFILERFTPFVKNQANQK